MGGVITRTSEISKTDVSVKGNEKCVVYTTSDSKTCTLRLSLENDKPKKVCRLSLKDYTIDSEGTTVDMKFIRTKNVFNISDVTHEGNCLKESKGPHRFSILYGVTNRVALLIVQKRKVGEKECYLIIHSCVDHYSLKYSVVGIKVCYDNEQDRLKCKISKGPSWYSSFQEVKQVALNFLKSKEAKNTSTSDDGNVINNNGTFKGHLNGSILEFNDPVFNFYLSK